MSDRLHPGHRKTTCSGCGKEKEAHRENHRYCLECHKKSMREYRDAKKKRFPNMNNRYATNQ